jgi:hypothetical protein
MAYRGREERLPAFARDGVRRGCAVLKSVRQHTVSVSISRAAVPNMAAISLIYTHSEELVAANR